MALFGLGKIGKGLIDGTVGVLSEVAHTVEGTIEDVEDILVGNKKEDGDSKYQDPEDALVDKYADEFLKEAEKAGVLDDLPSADDTQKDDDDVPMGGFGDERYIKKGKTTTEYTVLDEAEEKLVEVHTNNTVDDEDMMLPQHFSLKSLLNTNYLRFSDDNTGGFLRFSDQKVVSPYTKFQAIASKTEPRKQLVHIRCCYNNKFLVRSDSDSKYIAAMANEAEEDQSKWSCTLFEPVYDHNHDAYKFHHVQLGAFLCLAQSAPRPHTDGLMAASNGQSEGGPYLFKVVDWDSILILPKFVAFKGDNGKYLEDSNTKYLQFSASSAKNSDAAHEVISAKGGFIRLRHVQSGKYWIRDPNWIWLQSIDTSKDDPNTLFEPVKVGENTVALRSMGNKNFCGGLTIDGKTDCLNACDRTISRKTRLEVEEVVASRTIENIEYRIKDARVHVGGVVAMFEGTAENSTNLPDTVTFSFSIKKKSEATWSSSVSATLGVAAKFKADVPDVGSATEEQWFETSSEQTWGETKRNKSIEEITQTVSIPAMSKVEVKGIITEGKCDVPFSYTQHDVLTNGKQIKRRFEDGIFRGTSSMDFKFEAHRREL